ncbi:MAG: hypothetical protein ACREDG_09230 [Methylocella sp.]
MRFGHANTKTLHYEPVAAGSGSNAAVSAGYAWNVGGLSAAAGGRSLVLAGFGAALPCSTVGRPPVCSRANVG